MTGYDSRNESLIQEHALRVGAGLALLGVGLQFIRPPLTHPPVTADLQAPPAVKQILQTDCHSNQMVLPWFDRIVPAYWLVVRGESWARSGSILGDNQAPRL